MQWEDVAARYTSMLTGIDHLVVAVPDLDAAMANYRALGFTVVRGGRHPVATHNALIAFADGAYIELIGFYEADPTHRWWEPLQRGGGLVDFCMGTDALPDDAAAFRRAGMRMADAIKDVCIMLLPMLGVLVLIILWPDVALFLPKLISPEFLK